MKDGYWNAALHPDSQCLTAFSSPWGTFAYQVLSQGLISSAAHFQNWVEQKLRKHGILLEFAPFEGADDVESSPSVGGGESSVKLQQGNGFVCNYCDDLIVASQSIEEHKKHLRQLFEILSEYFRSIRECVPNSLPGSHRGRERLLPLSPTKLWLGAVADRHPRVGVAVAMAADTVHPGAGQVQLDQPSDVATAEVGRHLPGKPADAIQVQVPQPTQPGEAGAQRAGQPSAAPAAAQDQRQYPPLAVALVHPGPAVPCAGVVSAPAHAVRWAAVAGLAAAPVGRHRLPAARRTRCRVHAIRDSRVHAIRDLAEAGLRVASGSP
eukprot:SAG31_NODE_911_length_11071_cov_16.862195_6_plen_323_part_00